MAEAFVPLATWLRDARGTVAAAAAVVVPPAPAVAAPGAVDAEPPQAAIASELALLRLAAMEAFERASARALEAFAADVLGRELVLAPVDLDALVARAVARFAECEPVALALCASDAERVRSPLPIRVDRALAPGDLVIDVRDGSLHATFAFRVRDALAYAGVTS